MLFDCPWVEVEIIWPWTMLYIGVGRRRATGLCWGKGTGWSIDWRGKSLV